MYTIMHVLFYVIIIIFLICIFYFKEFGETVEVALKTRTLNKDGFVVMYDPKYASSDNFPINQLHIDALSKLPDGYMFMDYVYKIYDSSLYTFHRDVTSSKHTFDTDYPVYTMILYKADGCLLSLCPGSHSTYPFVFSRIVNIKGNKGTVFLFDSDLLHSGCINGCKPREVIQYKICHKNDIEKLKSLEGIRVNKKETCKNTLYGSIMRKLSYYFEFPINYIFTPFIIKKHDKETIIGSIQSNFKEFSYFNNI